MINYSKIRRLFKSDKVVLGYHDVSAIKGSYKKCGGVEKCIVDKTNVQADSVKGFLRSIGPLGGRYILLVPQALQDCLLKIKVKTDSSATVKVTHRLRGEKYFIGEHSVKQEVESGLNTVYLLFGDDQMDPKVLIELFGENVNASIQKIEVHDIRNAASSQFRVAVAVDTD